MSFGLVFFLCGDFPRFLLGKRLTSALAQWILSHFDLSRVDIIGIGLPLLPVFPRLDSLRRFCDTELH